MQIAAIILRRARSAAIILLCLTTSSMAHPHVWITVETTVLRDKDNFTSLKYRWTFDEYYTAAATEGFRKNQSGSFEREDLAHLAKINIDGLKEFGYFTYALLGDKAVKFGEPTDYRVDYDNGVLSLIFTLPFAQRLAAGDLSILVMDPTYFIAFELAKTNPVRIGEGAAKGCTITIPELNEGSSEAQRFGKAFADLGPNLGYTKIASISCNGH
jgi:ABC-type uncharacterized transport system substrate-binding protein